MKEDRMRLEIESVLEQLAGKGFSRSEIENELGYSENYIDQTLSRGGNKRFLNSLTGLNNRVLQKTIEGKQKTEPQHQNEEEKQTIQSLARSLELSNEARLKEASNVERLIALLEKQVDRPYIEPAPPGEIGTSTQLPERFNNKKEKTGS